MKYKWELTGDDENDLVAKIGEDMLRVERLDKKVWWFAVYVGKDECWMTGEFFPHVETKESAKRFAESIYNLIKSERKKIKE